MIQSDIRDTDLYRDAEALYRSLRQPGTGLISDAVEVHVSSDGQSAVFAGIMIDEVKGSPPTRICQLDLRSGDLRVLTFGPNTDRSPQYSPDGRSIAFLSDRHAAGDFQLYLLDPTTGGVRSTTPVAGWVEYFRWSPDGTCILLGVAGHGADVAGGQGAITSQHKAQVQPSWMPKVEVGDEEHHWRRAWVYEVQTGQARQASPAHLNVWEASWCGNRALALIASEGPSEGLWYQARLHWLDLTDGHMRPLHVPEYQLGWPAASPSGRHLAVVEGICSDRWIVAGDLLVINAASAQVQRLDTHGVDITYCEWRSDETLLLAGHRGFDTVVGLYAVGGAFQEVWISREITVAGKYVTVSGIGSAGDCLLIGEGFLRAPEIGRLRQGHYETVKSFDRGYRDCAQAIREVECVTWTAPDGLEIQGWLLKPHGDPPHPLILDIHGGPVFHWRPRWLGRANAWHTLMLVERGFAVFFPNPRGSTGRGQDFIRRVLGDMGGADTYDCLSGLDALVQRGLADPNRIGVTGASYGGFMTSWLITQDSRFAAAVSVAPVTNQVTEHLVSNIPHFVKLFLADTYTRPGGKYFLRSPVMYAHQAKTPTLNICGALDRCTPPEEAVQFHNALRENGVKSVLATYPEEGHGVRKFPAAIDYAARVVGWFQEHIPATPPRSVPKTR
jgi:dipeptidyl aminopeptidase/acylaminoacyl peptidase